MMYLSGASCGAFKKKKIFNGEKTTNKCTTISNWIYQSTFTLKMREMCDVVM